MSSLKTFKETTKTFSHVNFLVVYLSEAHPTDGWIIPLEDQPEISSHQVDSTKRLDVQNITRVRRRGWSLPINFVRGWLLMQASTQKFFATRWTIECQSFSRRIRKDSSFSKATRSFLLAEKDRTTTQSMTSNLFCKSKNKILID